MGLELDRLVPAPPGWSLPPYAAERRMRPAPRPLAERMAFWGVPGLSVALVDGGRVVATEAFGLADAASGRPVTPDTLFQAASISKPVTALGVLRLVAEGRLDLDADVAGYLPSWELRAALPGGGWRPRVTLRQLLSHTAGTTVHGFPGYQRAAPLPSLLQVLDGLAPANTAPVRVDTMPGVQFRYSGGGTSVVQLVMQEVTGEPFAELMRRLVLGPLGMERSAYGVPVDAGAAAHGHRTGGAPVAGGWHVYPELAAAALWTTAEDLTRVISGFQGCLRGEAGALLPQALAIDAARPQPGSGFGLGWEITGKIFRHTGGNEGFRCVLTGWMDAPRGVVAMTNGDDGDGLWPEVLATLAAARGWEGSGVAPAPAGVPGRYALREDFVFEVEAREGGLWVRAGEQAACPLEPDGAGGWAAVPLAAGFTFEDDGLVFRQNGQELPARRV
ncbi:MAG TPA: serine hydrolase domain-containing protein, partial [Bacillota bacterium]|nr:serine hydrolase domain-containing protein [Bacillota bacterium]